MHLERSESHRIAERAKLYRERNEACAAWAAGYGVIAHDDLTQVRVHEWADLLRVRGQVRELDEVYAILAAADRLASAGMWLVVHSTYARHVYLDGRDLTRADFKEHPEGHTGGSLNMVPAYVGYLAANAICGVTRSWLMGQGHCVAAIDSVNLLAGNLTPEHAARYDLSDAGLTRFVDDFYSYRPDSPRGSHVNAHTAGGIMEGGYLGFAELQYVHMPLPGERLVAFLSDGAFEEQRGSDWAPRWWRGEDSGLVAPIMIANGRRIDQRTTMAQEGGVHWFRKHLLLNGFDPIDIDGRDPAAFAWAMFEMEERLAAAARGCETGECEYPLPLPYAIAETTKGYGFPGAGTNRAHNLPLDGNPAHDQAARNEFNAGARRLWVPPAELEQAIGALSTHERQRRPRERDHALARRNVDIPTLPVPPWREPGEHDSPMAGIDQYFVSIVHANPDLRPRVGNPDELSSNRMVKTLHALKHRVTAPEPGSPESLYGAIITALNEEAVVSAALANKGGINLVVSYEAFAVKMLGAIRQELIFSRHLRESGRPPGWLAVPILLSSHTWENGKNEMSHQDPTLCEALLGELSDVSHVLFPPVWNGAIASLHRAYRARGEIWTMVVPKNELPITFSAADAQALVENGAHRVRGGGDESILLAAIGAYQLREALRAAERLEGRGQPAQVVYLLEPARYRVPRDAEEAQILASPDLRDRLFPRAATTRIFAVHSRPEPMLGLLSPLAPTRVLGYLDHGGTLDVEGMLRANHSTWADLVAAVADARGWPREQLLDEADLQTLRG